VPAATSEIYFVLKDLANEATLQWTGNFNPRNIGFEDFLSLYRSAL